MRESRAESVRIGMCDPAIIDIYFAQDTSRIKLLPVLRDKPSNQFSEGPVTQV